MVKNMRLGDVAIGQRYWLNGREYLRINNDLTKLFYDYQLRNSVCSLDLDTYKVMIHNSEFEVTIEEEKDDE